MGTIDGEIPNIVFLFTGLGFTLLAYIQLRKYGKTIETIFLSILAILFLLSYLAMIIKG